MRDQNTYSISTAIKQLSPLWRVSLFEQQLGTSKEVIDQIIDTATDHCKKEAALLAQCLDFNNANEDWAKSFFALHIAELIADTWSEKRTECLTFSYCEYLAGLATPNLYSGLPPSWEQTSSEVSYIATCINAMSKSLSAYNKFNLFHFDQEKIHNFFNGLILCKAQECVDKVISALPESSKNNDSISSLYQSFIKAAGNALSDLWLAESANFVSTYQLANSEQQELMRTKGGNLKLIEDNFNRAMNNLADFSLIGLEQRESFKLSFE